VTPERCTVLANKAVPLGEVKKAEGEKLLVEAEAGYEAADKSNTAIEDEALDLIQLARSMVDLGH
jgi:F-type H+-transporting ATPase subunit epsilon